MEWMPILAGVLLSLTTIVGTAFVVLGLPGIWLMVLAALGVEWWRPELLSWSAIITAAALSVLAEVAEFLAGAVGAQKAGGSKRAALGAIAGGMLGAIFGTVLIPIPIVGTVLGASIGAGAAAAGLELTLRDKTVGDAGRVGTGAFIGRLLATIIKTIFAVATAAVLIAAVCVSGW